MTTQKDPPKTRLKKNQFEKKETMKKTQKVNNEEIRHRRQKKLQLFCIFAKDNEWVIQETYKTYVKVKK